MNKANKSFERNIAKVEILTEFILDSDLLKKMYGENYKARAEKFIKNKSHNSVFATILLQDEKCPYNIQIVLIEYENVNKKNFGFKDINIQEIDKDCLIDYMTNLETLWGQFMAKKGSLEIVYDNFLIRKVKINQSKGSV